MKRRQFLKQSAVGSVIMSGLVLQGCSTKKEYDLLIIGGTVYDGLGNTGIEADVAVKGDRIAVIRQNINPKKAVAVIEAKGMAVAPGFVDPHTHTDIDLIVNPKAESKIRQGVTTEIGGNCGGSQFPLNDRMFDEHKEDLNKVYGLDLTWHDIQGFFNRLEQGGIANNHATLLGNGTLRSFVMGPYDKLPTSTELEKMKQVIREYMQAGAMGLSSGLVYTPSAFAQTDELIELCRELVPFDGVYATHIRGEGDELLESIKEAVTISRESGASLEIAHLKVIVKRNWHKINDMLAALDQAKAQGIPIQADRYPYIAGSIGLSIRFPKWVREGTTEDFIAKLKDPSLQEKIRAHVNSEDEQVVSLDKVMICSVLLDKNKHLEGKTVLQGAREANKSPYEFMRDLLIEEDGRVSVVGFGMDEDNLRRVLAHPLVTVGSDGNAVAPYGELGKSKPHPRYYGTFPRVLGRYTREEGILTLPEAVKKMTSMAASKFGLTGRGSIAEDNFADLVVFDPDTVIDKATFQDPHQYPEGIPYVVVNGKVVVSEDEHTGVLAGRVLRHGT